MSLKKKVKKVLMKLDRYSPKPSLYSIRMTQKERELFDRKIRNSAAYLEFGMGGSTFRALQKSNTKVYCIESSKDWISMMREYWWIRSMETERLAVYHVDIGPPKEWGIPSSEESKELFPNYSGIIYNMIPKKNIDTILIDGRFRVACALKAILECNSNSNLQILIHDFSIRPNYHIVLEYLDEVETADTLSVFKIKEKLDYDLVREAYEKYKYLPID